jgi:fatty acid desaturase
MAVTAEWPLNQDHDVATSGRKLWYLITLGLLVCVPYFWLERHAVFAVRQISSSPIDRWIPFVPAAAWGYLSLYLQLALPLWLSRESERLRQMVFGFVWITVVSHLLFFFWPTTIPSFSVVASNFAMRLILAADTNGNALPSLHASLAVYCGLCSGWLLKRRGLRLALWAWTALILVSTLLLKRHMVADVAVGVALGGFAFASLFRRRPAETPECEAWQITVNARRSLMLGKDRELAPLLLTNWRKRLVEIACFVTLALAGLGLSVWGIASSRWFALAAGTVLTAIALNAFVLLMHDGMHFTLFRSRRWNSLVSVLLGSTFLMSFTAYRIMHARHHRFLGDPRDPDDYQNYVRPRLLLWSTHFVRLAVGSLLYLVLIPILALKFGSDSDRRQILTEYTFLIALYSVLLRFVPSEIMLLAWFVPLLLVGSLTALRGFTQHGVTDATDPYLASRTVLPNPIVGFFLLHENYHLEHHLFPEVPSYHLPQLHRLIWRRLPRAVSSRSYLGFLARFLRAASRMDETPIGLSHPSKESV